MAFQLPRDDQQLVVIGRNGTGKTVAGAFHLSRRRYDRLPWVLIDYKGDQLLHEIANYGTEIDLDYTPKKPGIYIVHPEPETDDEDVEKFLYKIWKRGHTGIYCDEGYMLPQGRAWRGILTQGRAKIIPRIILTQRPVHLNRFVFSEANHYQLFHLNDERDKATVQQYMPGDRIDVSERLPQFCSHYYSVDSDESFRLSPVPAPDRIVQSFRDRIRPKRILL